MTRFALFVKETTGKHAGKFFRVTKKGRGFKTKALAEKRRQFLLPISEKKITIRKVRKR